MLGGATSNKDFGLLCIITLGPNISVITGLSYCMYVEVHVIKIGFAGQPAIKKSFGWKENFGTGPGAIKVGPPENTGF